MTFDIKTNFLHCTYADQHRKFVLNYKNVTPSVLYQIFGQLIKSVLYINEWKFNTPLHFINKCGIFKNKPYH